MSIWWVCLVYHVLLTLQLALSTNVFKAMFLSFRQGLIYQSGSIKVFGYVEKILWFTHRGQSIILMILRYTQVLLR